MMSSLRHSMLGAVVVGVVAATIIYRVPGMKGMTPLLQVALSFAIVFPPMAILTILSLDSEWSLLFMWAVGLGAGVVLDVLVSNQDRNLFPFEILWWCLLFGPAAFSGTVLVALIKRLLVKRGKSADS